MHYAFCFLPQGFCLHLLSAFIWHSTKQKAECKSSPPPPPPPSVLATLSTHEHICFFVELAAFLFCFLCHAFANWSTDWNSLVLSLSYPQIVTIPCTLAASTLLTFFSQTPKLASLANQSKLDWIHWKFLRKCFFYWAAHPMKEVDIIGIESRYLYWRLSKPSQCQVRKL